MDWEQNFICLEICELRKRNYWANDSNGTVQNGKIDKRNLTMLTKRTEAAQWWKQVWVHAAFEHAILQISNGAPIQHEWPTDSTAITP